MTHDSDGRTRLDSVSSGSDSARLLCFDLLTDQSANPKLPFFQVELGGLPMFIPTPNLAQPMSSTALFAEVIRLSPLPVGLFRVLRFLTSDASVVLPTSRLTSPQSTQPGLGSP